MTVRLPPREPASPGTDPLLAVACPECHVAIGADRSLAGSPARCPLCRAAFIVPVPPRPQAGADSEITAEALHRHAREDRSRRRARRNILMLLAGVAFLLVIVLSLGTRRPKKRR